MKKTLLIAAAAALVAVGLVRLELVAREPKVEDSILADVDQVFGNGAPAKETRDLLALATHAAQEAQAKAAKGDYRAAAEAAGKAFEAFKAAYETDSATLADVCAWSQKWLEAERKSAKSDRQDVAAIEAYLARTQTIHDKVKALHDAGARGGEPEKYYSMVYYLEDAKGMLKAARERPGKSSDVGQNKEASQLNVFALRNAKAADLIPILQAALNAAQGKGHLQVVHMAPDARTNSLVVSAPPEVMKVLAALLQRLDKTPSAAPPAKRSSQPQRVSALLQVTYPQSDSRPVDSAEVRTYRATQAELLRSPGVLRLALREPGIAELAIVKEQSDPIAWLEENLHAQYENDSEILRVHLNSQRPDEAAKLVNAVVKAYFEEIVYEAVRTQKINRDLLQRAYNDRETVIRTLRSKRADRAKALGIAESAQSTQIRLLFDEVAALRTAVATLSTFASVAELEVFDVETKLKIEQDPVKREAYIARKSTEDRRLQELKASYDAQEAEAADAEKRSKGSDAGKRLREQMKETEAAIRKRKSKIEQELSETNIESKAAELQGQLDVAKRKWERYQQQLKTAQANLDKKEKELNDIKIASVEMDDMAESLRNQEALRAKMFAELEAKRLEADAPPRIKLLEEARPPTPKNRER